MNKLTMALIILLTIGLYSCKQSNNPVDSGKNPETPIVSPVAQKYSISFSAQLSILVSRLNLYYSLAVDSVCINVKSSTCDTTGKLTIALSSATGIWNNFNQGSYTVTANVYATNKLLIVTKSKNVAINDSITYVSFDVSTPTWVPKNGLVACYQFSGNTNDTSGNGNNGINHGATLTTDRFNISNGAYQFNSSYIDLPETQSLTSDIKDSLTLSAWVYLDPNPAAGSTSFVFSTGNQNYYALSVAEKSSFYYSVSAQLNFSSSHPQVLGAQNLQPSQWYHIIMTYVRLKATGAPGELSLYINGVLSSSANYQERLFTNQGFNLSIGANFANSIYCNYFNGKIDDVRIYNRALNLTEITYLHIEMDGPVNMKLMMTSISANPLNLF